MSGSRHDWLDDETAERLLRGEPIVVEIAEIGEFDGDAAHKDRSRRLHALSALMSSVSGMADGPVEPEREEAALAAFRSAHADPGHTVAAAAHDVVADVITVGVGHRVVANGRRRTGRLRGWSGSAKVAVAAAVTATALASGFTAAAVGVIPSPFTGGGGLDPAPHAPGVHRPSIDASELPQMPEPADSASTTPTASGGAHASGRRPAQGPVPSSGGDRGHDDHGSGAKSTSGAHDVDTLCQAYFASESGHGSAVQHDSLNWLVAMAGGQKSVDSYCSHRLGHPAPRDSSSVVRPPSVPATGAGAGSGAGTVGGGTGTGSGAGVTGAGAGDGSFGPGSPSGSGSGSGGCPSRGGDGAFGHVSGATASGATASSATADGVSGANPSGSNASAAHGSGDQGSCGAGSGAGFGRHAGGTSTGSLGHLPQAPYVAAITGHTAHLRTIARPVVRNAPEKL